MLPSLACWLLVDDGHSSDVRHRSSAPIYAPSLFHTPDSPFAEGPAREALYAAVSHDGIRGLTGCAGAAPRVIGLATREHLRASPLVPTAPPSGVSPLFRAVELPSGAATPAPGASGAHGASLGAPVAPNASLAPAAPDAFGAPGSLESATSLAERAHAWAGRFVHAYVRRVWDEAQWETAWFCNPPHLRTVPGLSHFQ